MEKVLDFLRNRWVKFGVSFLSLCFPAFLLYVDWLAFAYYLEPVSAVPLFLLYVLVNVVFGGIMFYTRRQVITRIVACITPAIALVLLIIAFGQWYLIIPPVAICFFIFLSAGTNETFKTILGTIYLLLFVVGTLVYLTMLHFNLTVQTLLSLTECDVSKRTENYYYSPKETYRLVQYMDNAGNERKTASFYVELTENDISLPYLNCYKHLGSQKVFVTMNPEDTAYKWLNDNELFIDGRAKNMKDIFLQAEKSDDADEENAINDDWIYTYYETNDFTDDGYYGTAAAETSPVSDENGETEETDNTAEEEE